MDEIIDVIDENSGLKTGKTIMKSVAHKNGIWHSSVHLIIVSKDKSKILFQKRCNRKKFFPNMWDIAVGGHIAHGEDDYTALKREMLEELGLYLEKYSYEKLGVFKEKLCNNGIISNEFVYTYIIYDDIDTNELKLQEEEVECVKWFNRDELNNLIINKKIINHKGEYEILNTLLK